MTDETEGTGAQALLTSLPAPRMAPFLRETDDDAARALELYRKLREPLSHQSSGRGSGFVQRQRYVSSHRLLTATSTQDLYEN